MNPQQNLNMQSGITDMDINERGAFMERSKNLTGDMVPIESFVGLYKNFVLRQNGASHDQFYDYYYTDFENYFKNNFIRYNINYIKNEQYLISLSTQVMMAILLLTESETIELWQEFGFWIRYKFYKYFNEEPMTDEKKAIIFEKHPYLT